MAAASPPAYGTVAWAKAEDGRLSRRERIREIARGVAIAAKLLPAQAKLRLGYANPRALDFDLDRFVIPDSKLALEAEELCRESSSPMLYHHCHRTYIWGMALGAADGKRPDAELFYVASMLHDLALTERFRDYTPMPCFGARAGILAGDWARERGWPEHRCGKLGDVVSLHLNALVPDELGPEAQLIQAGAGLDVVGLRYWDLTPASIQRVLERHPRHGLKREGYPQFKVEARPGTRTQLLDRWLLFGTLTRHSPFSD